MVIFSLKVDVCYEFIYLYDILGILLEYLMKFKKKKNIINEMSYEIEISVWLNECTV